MTKPLSVSEARDKLAEVIGRVRFGGERVTLENRGRPVAVVVSVADAESLERMEDLGLVEIARERLEEYRRTGESHSHENVFHDEA